MDAITELKQNSVTTQSTKEETCNSTSMAIMVANSTVQAEPISTPAECICSSNNTQSNGMIERVILPAGIYEGARIKPNNDHSVYLILDGTKRHIPNIDTYNKLFNNWGGIQTLDPSTVDQVPLGLPLTNGAYLLKGDDNPVYLVSDGIKRHIMNPHVFNTFHFSWGKIITSQATAVAIPTGPQIR